MEKLHQCKNYTSVETTPHRCKNYTSLVENLHPINTNINTNTKDSSNSKELEPTSNISKNKKSKKKTKKVFEPDSIEYKLSEKFYSKMSAFNNSKYDEKPDLQKWSSEFEKLIKLDKVSIEDIESVIDWTFQEDNFWNDKIQSAAKLRKKDKDGVKYFNKLYKQMINDSNYQPIQKLPKEIPQITKEEFYSI